MCACECVFVCDTEYECLDALSTSSFVRVCVRSQALAYLDLRVPALANTAVLQRHA